MLNPDSVMFYQPEELCDRVRVVLAGFEKCYSQDTYEEQAERMASAFSFAVLGEGLLRIQPCREDIRSMKGSPHPKWQTLFDTTPHQSIFGAPVLLPTTRASIPFTSVHEVSL